MQEWTFLSRKKCHLESRGQFHQHFTCGFFWKKVFCAGFLYLHFRFVRFGRKNIGAKTPRKILVKLTSGCRRKSCILLQWKERVRLCPMFGEILTKKVQFFNVHKLLTITRDITITIYWYIRDKDINWHKPLLISKCNLALYFVLVIKRNVFKMFFLLWITLEST
jgi:hypothetical protein